MAYNNPATSGVDMSPELLVRLFESVDNLTTVKESTGDLSRMRRIAELSGGRLPFYNGSNPLVLDALRVGAAAGARRHRICGRSRASTCMTPSAPVAETAIPDQAALGDHAPDGALVDAQVFRGFVDRRPTGDGVGMAAGTTIRRSVINRRGE